MITSHSRAVFVIVSLVAAAGCTKSADTPRASTAPLTVGAAAPAYGARALAGDSVNIGGTNASATLVNVWATWCTSCREEFAELDRFRTDFPALRVIGVSVDQGGAEKVRRFVETENGRFPVIHDKDSRITRLYGVLGLPTTYLIGRDGRVRWMLTGSFLPVKATLEQAIRAELAVTGG